MIEIGKSYTIEQVVTPEMTARATATVTGVSENGKLITFRVEASDDWGPIGEGTHTRAIIANDRFLQKCTSKLTERK